MGWLQYRVKTPTVASRRWAFTALSVVLLRVVHECAVRCWYVRRTSFFQVFGVTPRTSGSWNYGPEERFRFGRYFEEKIGPYPIAFVTPLAPIVFFRLRVGQSHDPSKRKPSSPTHEALQPAQDKLPNRKSCKQIRRGNGTIWTETSTDTDLLLFELIKNRNIRYLMRVFFF